MRSEGVRGTFLYCFPLKKTNEYFTQMEKLLMEQNRLREQKKLQEDSLALKDKELKMLQQMVPAQPNFKVKHRAHRHSHLLCADI